MTPHRSWRGGCSPSSSAAPATAAGPPAHIGACYGDALLAGMGTGLIGANAAWNPIARVVQPVTDTAADYERLCQLYRNLYPATRDVTHALAALGKEFG